jgi:hypothetical protein
LIENGEYSQLSEYIGRVSRNCLIRPKNANFIFKCFGVKMKKVDREMENIHSFQNILIISGGAGRPANPQLVWIGSKST